MSYKVKNNCLKFSSLAILQLLLQFTYAQPGNKNKKELGVEKFADLNDLLTRHQKALGENLVGMVWTDTLVYKKVLGDFTERTIAPIGSASKWLTTALVMQFVDEGKISLDDKVVDYLPVFGNYGKNYITIRHCLTHFTGIQAEGKMFSKKKFASLEELIAEYAKHEIQTNPGTEGRYSEIGLAIAGRVLEVVSKKKFETLIKQKLLNPLAMRQSSFTMLDASAPDPSEGGQSTASDFMHFLQMLLQKGVYNGQRILSENSIKELRTITTPGDKFLNAPKSLMGISYTLGAWALDEENGEARSLINPGLPGIWPVVDWCHGYAALIFVKSPSGEPKKEIYLQMKGAIDDVVPGKCN
jgi:CubicO group peptidase (beta-lactamase class C family)